MSLVSNYAEIVRDGVDLKKVLAYMKAKGHTTLLPQVLTMLERGGVARDVVVVAHEKDVKKIHTQFPKATATVDPRVVGGYLARQGSTLVDATYRKALVQLYKRTIAS